MRRRILVSLALAGLLALVFFSASGGGQLKTDEVYARPKLILVLVIDQFRYDYLVRFRPYFVAGGFNLLLGGANFVDCRYDYATTITAPGHATLFTGAYPNLHGIVENEWYDTALHRKVYCVEDRDTRLVRGPQADRRETTTAEPGFSPRNLKLSTLGDELRIASNFRSKVIALSLKDRGAVIPGGYTANAAYWYDAKNSRFVSSTYYMQALPSWVVQFNAQVPAKAYCGKSWQALPETPDAGGKVLSEYKPAANEPCLSEKFLEWLDRTPYMNEIELNFAREAIKNERLGQGSETDLVAISLSENDYVGHAFGPYGPEVADTTLRTDRYLAEFLHSLDQSVGLNDVWIVLSADHGVAPNPRFIKEHRLGPGNAQPAAIRDAVEQALTQSFGQDQWIEAVTEFSIYLNQQTIRKHQLEPAKAESVAAEAALAAPGVRAAYTRTQLLYGVLGHTPLSRKASNSFFNPRSGDIFMVLEPYAVPVQGEIVSTHGSPWSYDAQVPLIFWGEAFRPGRYTIQCEPIDLSPTIAAALGLTQPAGTQGRPLTVALR